MKPALIILVSLLMTFSASAVDTPSRRSGNTVANGGDSVAAEFGKLARQTIMSYGEWQFSKQYRPIVRKLKQAVLKTRVQSEEELFLDSREVDAINIPSENLIIVSRSRWKPLRRNDKIQLVIHEYLWVAGYDDSNYQLSTIIKAQSEIKYGVPVIPHF